MGKPQTLICPKTRLGANGASASIIGFAAVLRELGIGKGDRIIIYMPMIPEAVFAMLACVRLGAIHSVVFGGFAAANLAKRIVDARPKLLITSDAGMRGGKLLRRRSQALVEGRDPGDLSTLDDPAGLDEIRRVVKTS